MKNRFVAGIVVVLLLEVCFQAFNELQRVDDRYLRYSSTVAVASPVEYLPIAVAELPTGDDYFDDKIGTNPPTIPSRQTRVLRPNFASFRPERPPQPLFEPIRITYPSRAAVALTITPPRPAPLPEPATVPVNETQRTEFPKKNEQSVVARVVKKPYELVKFVGSKLK